MSASTAVMSPLNLLPLNVTNQTHSPMSSRKRSRLTSTQFPIPAKRSRFFATYSVPESTTTLSTCSDTSLPLKRIASPTKRIRSQGPILPASPLLVVKAVPCSELAIGSDVSQKWMKQSMLTGYRLFETIGKGSTSKVKRAMDLFTKQIVAIKIVSKETSFEDTEKLTRRETEILSKLNHFNIVKLYKVIETPTNIYIIMEYVSGIDLNSYILQKIHLSIEESKKLFFQLSSALSYCHEKGVIHRDIKTKNIMVDDEGDLKLIDFGLGSFHSKDQFLSTFCGTPAFACPEMILGKQYKGPEVDVWSAGVVLFSMVTGILPFDNVSSLLVGQYDRSHPRLSSKDLQELVQDMICLDPLNRTTMKRVCESSWFHKQI